MQAVGREFFVSGGTLPLDSESYIERSADRELLAQLENGRYCYVLNSRQVGKSSLSVRTIARLNQQGIRTVFIDLTQIGGRNVQAEQWYAGLTGEVGRALGLSKQVLDYFRTNSDHSPMWRFFGAIREVVLENTHQPVVIFIDEIDATRNLPFDTDEFFAGIRESYNRRVQDERCERLTFCLIGVAVPNDLIRDPATTPFNIGERIRLQDFNLEEIQRLAPALGPNGSRLASRVHYWTNGQPFLTQSLCREIASDARAQDEPDVDAIVQRLYLGAKAIDTNLNLADVANRVLSDPGHLGDPEKHLADILSTYERVWGGGSIKDDEANRIAVVLKLSGLLRPDGVRLVVRNRIYHDVFDRTWIHVNMPGQEVIRQRQSFRRGLIRGVALTAAVGSVVGTLALLAFRARQEAIAAESALDYKLYVSDMNSLRLFEGAGDGARMAALLERSRTNSHRGFEWNFWMGRLHDSPEEYTLDYSAPGKTEYGLLSQDGNQVCIRDTIADLAVAFDRRTRRVLGSTHLGRNMIVATKSGFVAFNIDSTPAYVTDVATGKLLCQIGTPGYHFEGQANRELSGVLLTRESNLADPQKKVFTLWDLNNGKRLQTYLLPTGSLTSSIYLSKSGQRFTYTMPQTSGQSNPGSALRLVVWDFGLKREVDSFPYSDLCFGMLSESGRVIAYWDEHHLAKLRYVDEHRSVDLSVGSGEDVPLNIEVSPDDRTLVYTTSDGLATIREIPSGKLLAVKSNLRSLTPADRDSLWIGSSSTVRILNLTEGGQGIVGTAQTISRDGSGTLRLTSKGGSAAGRLTDPELRPLPSLSMPKASRDLTYNGLWCLDDARPSHILSVSGSMPPLKLRFNAENVACGLRPEIFAVLEPGGIWHGISGSDGKDAWATKFEPAFRGMWMSPNGRRLVASTQEGYISCIDPKTGKVLHRIGAHKVWVSSLNFSRDGSKFVSGGGDGQAILWETDTLRKLAEFKGNGAQEVQCADISPDGTRVATCNITGAWQLWDSSTGEELTEIRASKLPLRSVVFTSDGRSLVTSGDDGEVRSWKALDRDPTVRIPLPSEARKNVQF